MNRRSFLKSSAAACAAVVVAPLVPQKADALHRYLITESGPVSIPNCYWSHLPGTTTATSISAILELLKSGTPEQEIAAMVEESFRCQHCGWSAALT